MILVSYILMLTTSIVNQQIWYEFRPYNGCVRADAISTENL